MYAIYHYVNRGATCYYDISRRPLFHRVSRAAYNRTLADYAFSWLARRNYAANYVKCLLFSTRTPRLSILVISPLPRIPLVCVLISDPLETIGSRAADTSIKEKEEKKRRHFFPTHRGRDTKYRARIWHDWGGPVKERFNPALERGEGGRRPVRETLFQERSDRSAVLSARNKRAVITFRRTVTFVEVRFRCIARLLISWDVAFAPD